MGKTGLGQSTPPMQNAERFILVFRKWAAKGEQAQIQFLKSKQAQLNESLLEVLPLVFKALTTDEPPENRQKIAFLFVEFGDSVWRFPLGNRMLNLELSITAYELALQVYTRDAFPENWAMTQNNLGIAYADRIRGERADNLEEAITASKLALQVYTREAFPEEWADTQHNLGNAYAKRILEDRADNLEQAITAYQLALQVRTQEAFPEKWADTQHNLGGVYGNRIRGERADNLEEAIAASKLALQVYTRDAFPENWAMTQNNLGIAYADRIRGERADNLEEAITAYELALQVYTRNAFPEEWAITQNNLGNAYVDRIRGARFDNLEQAIASYELTLQVRTRDAFPEKWAMTQNNLGDAYRERIQGERADNLEQAISLYNQASQVFTRETFPTKWAETQGNLAEALMKRAALSTLPDGKIKDLDAAITLLQAALEVAVTGSPNFIDCQYRLGNALSRRYEYNQKASDLKQALNAYQIALDAISPEHYDRQQIWQALPTTQSILGSRLVRDGEWQEGLQLLLNSVSQLSTGDNRLAHANALFQTGLAHEVLTDLDNARLYYRDALRWYEYLKDQPGIAKSRTGLGAVLVSQGHLEKGMAELLKARESYEQLVQPDKASEVDSLYQAAQRALERQASEVYA